MGSEMELRWRCWSSVEVVGYYSTSLRSVEVQVRGTRRVAIVVSYGCRIHNVSLSNSLVFWPVIMLVLCMFKRHTSH